MPQRLSWLRVLGEGIAALNHEPLHDAVKTGAVVEAFFGKGLEILDRFRRDVGPKFDDHFAVRSF